MAATSTLTQLPGGVYTALVTPFQTHEDAVDDEALRKLTEAQVTAGVAGVVTCGSTGESPTLTEEEREHILEVVIDQVAGRCLVLAGTGAASTAVALARTKAAGAAGADAVMLVMPWYNKPTQAGLEQHIRTVSSAGVPILLYDNPGRTGVALKPSTVFAIAKDCPTVLGLKDASGQLKQVISVLQGLRDTRPDFSVFVGGDSLTVPAMAMGASGTISVLSNLCPGPVVAMVAAAAAGDFAKARAAHFDLMPLVEAYASGANPMPLKTMMDMIGLIPNPIGRSPLVELEGEEIPPLLQALRSCVASLPEGVEEVLFA